jgi:hypothetical protein
MFNCPAKLVMANDLERATEVAFAGKNIHDI